MNPPPLSKNGGNYHDSNKRKSEKKKCESCSLYFHNPLRDYIFNL